MSVSDKDGALFKYQLVDASHQSYDMRCHLHDKTELIYVTSGKLQLRLDQTVITLCAGELCYISGGVLHGGVGTDCVFETLVFDALSVLGQNSSLREYIAKIESAFSSGNCRFIGQSAALRIFSAAKNQKGAFELNVISALCDFYAGIPELYENQDAVYDKNSLWQVKTAVTYIEANYKESITLEQIAHVAKLSPKYFCRYFKSVTNRTPIDYLNLYRIETACKLLDEGFSVSETADECGFSDASYFVRAFKKYKGVTPKQYALKKEGHCAYIY